MTPFEPPEQGGAVARPARKSEPAVACSAVRAVWPMPVHKTALAIIVGTFLFGCGSPGVPTPRRPIVPVPVGDLSARQVGDTIILNFTLPTTSTDLQPLVDIPSVEVYRNTPQTATPAAKSRAKNKNTERLVDTIPSEMIEQYRRTGHIEFPDKLNASDLTTESGTDLTYTVRARVSRAKASADSNAVTVRVYPPPATVQGLRVTPTEEALVLDWSAAQAVAEADGAKSAGFRIYRAEVDPTTADTAVLNPSQAKLLAPEQLLGQTTATEYRDMSFQFGHTYLYEVRAVEQFGPATIESADSTPAVLTAKDIFPPAAPRDLEAVSVAATKEASASVELTWTINTEPDLAGYNVYRSGDAETPGQKLNSELLLVPTFRDISVVPGKGYFYRVGAVDQSGNESPLSSPVEAQVPGP
jgi:hypothetical protein